MRKLIKVIVVLTLSYFQDSNALKCYLCVGSTTSDCAAAKPTSMVEHECPIILIPPRHHRHHRHHHQRGESGYDTTTVDTPTYMVTTPMPVTKDFATPEAEVTTSGPNELKKVYIPTCTYMKIKGTNETGAFVGRGCGYMPPNKEFCSVMKNVLQNLVECKSCDTDICN